MGKWKNYENDGMEYEIREVVMLLVARDMLIKWFFIWWKIFCVKDILYLWTIFTQVWFSKKIDWLQNLLYRDFEENKKGKQLWSDKTETFEKWSDFSVQK